MKNMLIAIGVVLVTLELSGCAMQPKKAPIESLKHACYGVGCSNQDTAKTDLTNPNQPIYVLAQNVNHQGVYCGDKDILKTDLTKAEAHRGYAYQGVTCDEN
jgi:hypothetical protein